MTQGDTFHPMATTTLLSGKSYSVRDENAINFTSAKGSSEEEDVSNRTLLRKRKREEEAVWKKVIKRKIKEEERRVIEEQENAYQINSEMYALFNDLQGISKDFHIAFETPELVVVGNQSDGKSSFIEGLLGFQFNIVASNIGTRRPLILQMLNNPGMKTPRCRFRKERLVSEDEDPFEDPIDTDILSQEISIRTDKIAGKGDTISPVPIILRVEYCYCANLTIWDMPGFRHGGDPKLSQQIQALSERVMRQKSRIIICIEQSTTEWANSISRPIVRKIDPNFSRTVLVNTKFDNRVKELRNSEETHKYLDGEGLPANKKPFFISLPIERDLDTQEFKEAIKEAYIADYQSLLKSRFDENKYFGQIGFYKTKNFLEKLLTEKYHQSLRPTLNTLESICRKTRAEISRIEAELTSTNVDVLKRKALSFVQQFSQVVEKLLEGSIVGDPDTFGQTLEEERSDSCISEWPNAKFKFDIVNQDIKLYGGSQFQRLMNEFEYIAHSTEFPPTSVNEVASAIGISKSHNVPMFETAASDIVKIKARTALLPLISIVLKRCGYIIKRLFHIAVSVIRVESEEEVNDELLNELQSVFARFIEEIEVQCKEKMRDDFDTLTRVIDWDLLHGFVSLEDESYNYLSPTPEETLDRVVNLMENTKHRTVEGTRSRRINGDTYEQVRLMAARLFAGIRFFFVKFIRNKFNAFFLDPVFRNLSASVTSHFRKLTDQQFEELFKLGAKGMNERLELLRKQLQRCETEKKRFETLFSKLQTDFTQS